ncbi:MAG: hypothetical protein AAF413_00445 [Patescibacteria group bacterium]
MDEQKTEGIVVQPGEGVVVDPTNAAPQKTEPQPEQAPDFNIQDKDLERIINPRTSKLSNPIIWLVVSSILAIGTVVGLSIYLYQNLDSGIETTEIQEG